MLVEMRDGDVLQRLRRRVQPVLDRLLAQDRDPGLQLGWLDIGLQAPLEPAPQPVLERDQALRRAVRGDHDLLAGVVQRVEGVEELLLGSFLVLQELDVVHQQHVDVAVAAAEPVLLAVADHVDEVVSELFRAHVPDLQALVKALGVVADGVQQMRLAEAGVAVDEQRVVGLGRRLGDGDGRRVREPVARPDDEGLERVLRVQPGLARSRRLATSALRAAVAVQREGWTGPAAGRLQAVRQVAGQAGRGTGLARPAVLLRLDQARAGRSCRCRSGRRRVSAPPVGLPEALRSAWSAGPMSCGPG